MRIMLACNAGMSTSLVVAKMQDAAKAQGKDYKIWAVEQGEIQNELGNFDVLLLDEQRIGQLIQKRSYQTLAECLEAVDNERTE